MLIGLSVALLASGLLWAGSFRDQRVKFREEINLKVEEPMDAQELYHSVTFKNEKAWDFKVTPAESEKLKGITKEFFGANDDKMLAKMVSDMGKGRFIVFKEYLANNDGVNLKCIFLSPKVPYWKALIDIPGIEKLFYVYNFSLLLANKGPNDNYVLLDTEGKYMGFGKSVAVPVFFHADEASKTLSFRRATQKEATDAVNALPAKSSRTSLDDRFIDLARSNPWFQEKDASGNYLTSDKDILELLDKNIIHEDTKCDVYASTGRWQVMEDVSPNYLVVDYSLKTVVNIRAFIPPNLPLLGPMFKKIAQNVSDEVSAKYLPLSMKNFRDHTAEWAKSGK